MVSSLTYSQTSWNVKSSGPWLHYAKLVEGYGIPVEIFQILKDDAVKVQYASQFVKLNSGHRTGKGQVSFQSQRKAMAKNVQTTTQLHSSHMLKILQVMLKILQARLQQYMNGELPDVQASFRKGRGTRDQLANTRWIIKKPREFQKNIYFCFIDYAKAFQLCGSQ